MCPNGDVSANCCGSHQVQVHGVWLSWLTTSYPSMGRFVEDFSVVWLKVNFHPFVLPFYGLECSTVVGGGSRHGLYRDQSRIGLPLQNNQFYSSNAWFASCMIVHFSAHISKWELVCKFGVIFHTSIISCLCSRFHVWNKWFFYSLITFSYTKCFVHSYTVDVVFTLSY